MVKKRTSGNPTRNPTSPLYRRLTRLFSGPIVDYKAKMPSMQKRYRLNKYKFKNANGGEFKRHDFYNPFANLQLEYILNQDRMSRYEDFRQMEYMPELAAALDIYADEVTSFSEMESILKIESSNEEIKTVLNSLFYDVLNVEHNLFSWTRNMCKYGDYFLYLDIDDDEGITSVVGLPANEVERLEGVDPENPNYIQFQWNAKGATFENWQVSHFRILGNDRFVPYGYSVLAPALRIWKQLTLIEDAMMAYRVVRSPERRVFYIDVGNIDPKDVEQYMMKIQTQMKRNQIVNSETNKIDLRFNPQSIEEDFYIPVRQGSQTKIESLPGGTYTGDIDDVKYLRDKLFSAIKIPQAYLSQDGDVGDRGSLTQKDIVFSKTIQRIQLQVISELTKIATIHLYTLGYRYHDLVSFDIKLNNPSKIAEMQRLEELRSKFDIAASANASVFSNLWVARNIFNLSEDEILRNDREKYYDKKLEAALALVGEEGGDEGDLGGGLGDLGDGGDDFGDLGDEGDLEGEPMSDFTTDDGETPAEDEDILLSAPAKRDEEVFVKMPKSKVRPGDKWTGSAKSNGKMNLKKPTDARDGMGPRQKNMLPGIEKARSTTRNIFPGLDAMHRTSKGLMEEERVVGLNNEIKALVEGLEKKDDKKAQ